MGKGKRPVLFRDAQPLSVRREGRPHGGVQQQGRNRISLTASAVRCASRGMFRRLQSRLSRNHIALPCPLHPLSLEPGRHRPVRRLHSPLLALGSPHVRISTRFSRVIIVPTLIRFDLTLSSSTHHPNRHVRRRGSASGFQSWKGRPISTRNLMPPDSNVPIWPHPKIPIWKFCWIGCAELTLFDHNRSCFSGRPHLEFLKAKKRFLRAR